MRLLAALFVIIALVSNVVRAQSVVVAQAVEACRDGSPIIYFVVDGVDSTDCSVGGADPGTEVPCSCLDGVLAAMGVGGGSGDVEAVWTCTSGNCNALTAAAGDSLDTGAADSSSPATRSTSLPGACNEGNIHHDTDAGSMELYLCTATNTWTRFAPSLPMIRNPRATPHAQDCEFSGSICSATWSAGAGTSAPTNTAVGPLDSVSGDPRYDVATWPGWLLVQSDESAAAEFYLTKAITLDTNATIVLHLMQPDDLAFSGSLEGRFGIYLSNSGDSNEFVYALFGQDGGSQELEMGVNNNGSFTANDRGFLANVGNDLVIWKAGNVYHFASFFERGGMLYWGSYTKTGVTTLDQWQLVFVTSNDTPSVIYGVDYLRYYSSVTFGIVNE